jgi:hypothetical protein
MRISGLLVAAVWLSTLPLTSKAHADFIANDILNNSYYYPNTSTRIINSGNLQLSSPGFVGWSYFVGVEQVHTTIFANPTANQIAVTMDASNPAHFFTAPFNGVVITDITSANISGVTVDRATTIPGFTASDLASTPNSVSINLQNLSVQFLQQVVVDVLFAPPPSSQVANVATAVINAYQNVYGSGGQQQQLNATYQQAINCIPAGTCNPDTMQQQVTQNYESIVGSAKSVATSSIGLVTGIAPDITLPDLVIAGITGQLTAIGSNMVSFFKWLATKNPDPPVSILGGSATGYHINDAGLSYDFYDLFVTMGVDPADLLNLSVGDQFFSDLSIFDSSLPGLGWGTITDISLTNDTVTFELQEAEFRSVPEPSTIAILVGPLLLVLGLHLVGRRNRRNPVAAA